MKTVLLKRDVQKRVRHEGKALPLNEFKWDAKTQTFITFIDHLIIDCADLHNCTFKTGSNCTFITGDDCTFRTGGNCTFRTDDDCTFTTGGNCTFTTGRDCKFTSDWHCTFKTGWNCTFTTCWSCTFKTGSRCTFTTDENCTFTTGRDCIFKTGGNCTFTTGRDCIFKTGWNCIWSYNNIQLTVPPAYFNGSAYSIGFLRPGWVKSGCIEKPITWWEENVERCAEENEYTPVQIKEYKYYITYIAEWMKINNVYEDNI
jgi:uncharacterized cupin superfamily protein